MKAKIRKLVVQIDEIRREMDRAVEPPTRKALAMAVIENPYAGRWVENLDELIAIGEELGGLLGRRCVQALGLAPGQAQSYGKAAIVGEAGELEHAAAILHPKLGAPLRAAVEKGAALVPSAKKRAAWAPRSTCRWATRTPPSCAATSTRWKRASATRRAPTRSFKIGEINSYKAQPAFLEPYKKGMELALDEINAAGGVAGKKIELVTRDDNANPGDAVRVAEELVSREKVDVLTGTFLSHIGLAVTDFAKQRKVLFLAAEPLTDKIVWEQRQPLHLPPAPLDLHAGGDAGARGRQAEEEALGHGLPQLRVRPVGGGHAFKTCSRPAQPDVEFVAEQAPPLGKLDAGSVVQALADAKPDAIFNVLFGADLAVRARGQYARPVQGPRVVSLLTGEPEYLDPLKDETPNGWIVTGYPWYGIQTPEHKAFLRPTRSASTTTIRAWARSSATAPSSRWPRAIAKAGSTDTEKMVAAFKRPAGRHAVRPDHLPRRPPVDDGRLRRPHQAKDGKGVMVDYRYMRRRRVPAAADDVKKCAPP
jgi:branched-chain amino acid transport system substrate-binding protein